MIQFKIFSNLMKGNIQNKERTQTKKYYWRPSSLSELTPIVFNMELTHLGLEVFYYTFTPSSEKDSISGFRRKFYFGEKNSALLVEEMK